MNIRMIITLGLVCAAAYSVRAEEYSTFGGGVHKIGHGVRDIGSGALDIVAAPFGGRRVSHDSSNQSVSSVENKAERAAEQAAAQR